MTQKRDPRWETAKAVLQLGSQLVEGARAGMERQGFDDVRAIHGFAFVRIVAGDARTSDIAEYLGVTKQAAAQLVEHLVSRGYVVRRPDPRDARAQLLFLTDHGFACAEACRRSAAEVVESWRKQLGAVDYEHLRAALDSITVPGRLRPAW